MKKLFKIEDTADVQRTDQNTDNNRGEQGQIGLVTHLSLIILNPHVSPSSPFLPVALLPLIFIRANLICIGRNLANQNL